MSNSPAEAHGWTEFTCPTGKKRLHIDIVKNHPKFGTKQGVITSSIQSIDREAGFCQTRNTLYQLFNEATNEPSTFTR